MGLGLTVRVRVGRTSAVQRSELIAAAVAEAGLDIVEALGRPELGLGLGLGLGLELGLGLGLGLVLAVADVVRYWTSRMTSLGLLGSCAGWIDRWIDGW